jgi:hypothetical protein
MEGFDYRLKTVLSASLALLLSKKTGVDLIGYRLITACGSLDAFRRSGAITLGFECLLG